jgi:hypothetical protein
MRIISITLCIAALLALHNHAPAAAGLLVVFAAMLWTP